MEPITLITSALTAGIAALGKETVKAGAKDAYNDGSTRICGKNVIAVHFS